MPHKILFVDDEPLVTEALKRAMHKEPYDILSANSAARALEILAHEPVDVVISDEMMPGMLGSEFLAVVFRDYPDTIRIILTGHANIETALRAINEGHVYRFLIKPCNQLELSITIRQALQQKELTAKSRRLLQTVKQQHAVLEEMEERHPGITTVARDATGAIVLDDADCDLDALIEQIRAEVEKCDALFHDAKGR